MLILRKLINRRPRRLAPSASDTGGPGQRFTISDKNEFVLVTLTGWDGRTGLHGQMSPGDLATLDVLIGSDGAAGVLRRGDLTVEAERTVWIARRPSDS